MLTDLHIKDLVIVRSLTLVFEDGMTVLTGETGAGKSILIDALGLALGDRCDSSIIREGAEHTEVSAVFDLAHLQWVREWLRERSLEADGECMLRRVVSRRGRSRGYVNGRPVPIQSLHELGDLLLSIHGQNAHHALLRSDHQRRLLDAYADHEGLVEQTRVAHVDWQRARNELDALQHATQERATRRELLQYQVKELDELALKDGELAELDAEHHRLANTDRIRRTSEQLLADLQSDEQASVTRMLCRCTEELRALTELDPSTTAIYELMQNALIQVEEASSDLRSFAANLEDDPATLQAIEERLGLIQDIARKHHLRAQQLTDLHRELASELEGLDGADTRLQELAVQTQTLEENYLSAAMELRRSRQQAAGTLSAKVTSLIRELGMPSGEFQVALEEVSQNTPNATGLDRVSYLVNSNPGQSPQPMNKVASGGELSRIGLAIQVATARGGLIPTLIFDEVDVGIGGGVAEIVGRLLRTLGETRQVLCVTHLPQVASQGHQHLRVQKTTREHSTETTIDVLSAQHRVDEIARMLGGVKITQQTRAHADEMVARAQDPGA